MINHLKVHKQIRIGLLTMAILSIPFVATLVSKEFNWSIGDFIVMALLLQSFFYISHWAITKSKLKMAKWMILVIILFAFLLIWAELAVGIIS